uniref:Polysaccharide chain length determinant N-terminal domain-containing protein n=1 Tax=Roseihalotalea indica TaxID=2867963 RepID=A0AA49GIV8_9BACT|nr:hypothetical protein K4G66_19030 [Tunicatimonas sp. TK19036]
MEEVGVIFRALLNNWLKLVIMPVLAAGLVFYLTKDQPKKYVTNAKLIMNFPDNKAISLGDNEMKQYQILTYFQNITELVKAEKTINKVCLMVIQQALLDSGYFKLGNEPLLVQKDAIEKRIAELERLSYKLDETNPIDTVMMGYLNFHKLSHGRISEQIDASRIRDSNFLKFSFTEEESGEKTYILSKLIIQALIEENKKIAKSQIYGHRTLVEKLVNEAKADLDAKIKRLESFKVENNIINLEEYTKAIVTYLVDLEAQRGVQMATIAASQKGKSEVITTTEEGNELSVDLKANKEILELKKNLKELTRKRMLASFDSSNFQNSTAIEETIEETKDEITNKLVELSKNVPYDPTRIQMELANRYLAYDLDEAVAFAIVEALDEEISRAQTYTGRFASMESIIGTIHQEIATAQNVYLQLLNKLNVTQSLEYGSGENVIEVVDPPRLPQQPEASKQMILVVISGVAIFILFAGGIVILHLLDASIVSVKKFEKESGLKVISAIPALVPPKKDSTYFQSVQLIHRQQVIHLSKLMEQHIEPANNVFLFLSSQKDAKCHELAKSVKEAVGSETRKLAIVDADWTFEEEREEFEDLRELMKDGKTPLHEEEILEKMNQLKKENTMVIVVVAPTNLIADYRFWVQHFPMVVYIFNSGPVWSKVDARFEKFINYTPLTFIGTVLNNVNVDQMEDFIGDVPKKRTLFRVLGKRLLRRDF